MFFLQNCRFGNTTLYPFSNSDILRIFLRHPTGSRFRSLAKVKTLFFFLLDNHHHLRHADEFLFRVHKWLRTRDLSLNEGGLRQSVFWHFRVLNIALDHCWSITFKIYSNLPTLHTIITMGSYLVTTTFHCLWNMSSPFLRIRLLLRHNEHSIRQCQCEWLLGSGNLRNH